MALVRLDARVPEELLARLDAEAAADRRNRSSMLRLILERGLDELAETRAAAGRLPVDEPGEDRAAARALYETRPGDPGRHRFEPGGANGRCGAKDCGQRKMAGVHSG